MSFNKFWEDFAEIRLETLAAVLVAELLALALWLLAKKGNVKWTTREITMGALCLSIAFILSYLRLFRLANAGSITTASMLPIMVFAYVYGTPKGLLVGFAYAVLQFIQSPQVFTPLQVIIDYPLSFGALAIAGLFRKRLLLGITVSGLVRAAMHILSGALFFSEYAGDQNPWIYSAVYNLSYMIPEILICLAVAIIPGFSRFIEELRVKAQPA